MADRKRGKDICKKEDSKNHPTTSKDIMENKKNKLNNRQQLFCKEYIVDFNATRSAKAAGYSEKTAYAIGHELLKKHEIQSAIKKEIEAREHRTEISADRVLQEIAAIAFSDIKDFVNIGDDGQISIKKPKDIPEGLTRCIESIQEDRAISERSDGKGDRMIVFDKIKYRLHSKPRALEMLARHLALYNDDKMRFGFDVPEGDAINVKMKIVHINKESQEDERDKG